ncbi:MAG: MBL fold metallo-hydrolase [Desulfomonile tiedjei]|nr:MBL fold metallo-hydrolase [Desulfomonile tiedjei]
MAVGISSLAAGSALLSTKTRMAEAGQSSPASETKTSGTRLILLGTAGGPRPNKVRSSPAQVILVNSVPYVVDCGYGVARQLAMADVPLPKLRHVFLTHHHSDHNADYGNLILLSWAAGLKTPVDTYGPPPIEKMTKLFWELNDFDINIRIADEKRVPLAPLVKVHEFDKGGLVMQDENVKVTATLVNHPPVVPAFAYRFDTGERSIVISGDTTPSDNLIKLAQGADVMVHEVIHKPSLARLVAKIPNADKLLEHIVASHTTHDDVGKVAKAAGVKTLVLSHIVPADDTSVTDEIWIEGAKAHFDGKVIVGRDLMEI